MNPAAFALRKRTLMVVLTLMALGGGILAYQSLGRLEDPTFTIKTALVVTRYPGASPLEVEEEVTDLIEEAVQALGQVKEIYSTSQEGLSVVYVDIQDTYTSEELPQIWAPVLPSSTMISAMCMESSSLSPAQITAMRN